MIILGTLKSTWRLKKKEVKVFIKIIPLLVNQMPFYELKFLLVFIYH